MYTFQLYILYVQEVLTDIFSKLLYNICQDFFDIQYESIGLYVKLYCPGSQPEWRRMSPLSVPRDAAAWAAEGGKLYVFGGSLGNHIIQIQIPFLLLFKANNINFATVNISKFLKFLKQFLKQDKETQLLFQSNSYVI